MQTTRSSLRYFACFHAGNVLLRALAGDSVLGREALEDAQAPSRWILDVRLTRPVCFALLLLTDERVPF
jgi:hypothetical protein